MGPSMPMFESPETPEHQRQFKHTKGRHEEEWRYLQPDTWSDAFPNQLPRSEAKVRGQSLNRSLLPSIIGGNWHTGL